MCAGSTSSIGLTAVHPEGIIVQVSPNGPADQAGVRQADIIERINGYPLSSLVSQEFTTALRAPTVRVSVKRMASADLYSMTLHAREFALAMKPVGRRLVGDIGYVELPGISGTTTQVKEYATTAQQLLREMDQAGVRAWIVDLRRNGGGNMWPMLAGLGPLLGEGELGAFVYADERSTWSYRNGQALLEGEVLSQVDEPCLLRNLCSPVAVLLSRLTRSSGELTYLAFHGKPNVRSFGEPTAGVPTANSAHCLDDGAMIHLTVALGADRTGRTFDGPVTPDHPVQLNWASLNTDQDPVLQAAVQWIGNGAP